MQGPSFKIVRYGPNTYFLGGDLDMATAPTLVETVAPSIAGGGLLLLDLAALTFIDSTGIHAFLQIAKALGDDGCLLLHAPPARVRRVLELVAIDTTPNLHLQAACPSDTLPSEIVDWQTPHDLAAQFEELRRLGSFD